MPRFLQALKSLATGRPATVNAAEAAPPFVSASFRKLALHVPDRAKRCLAYYLGDKSHAELVFLAAVLLTVLLFVVVVPACETLLGDDEKDEEDGGCPSASPSSRMLVYKPGVGVVDVDARDLAEETALVRASSGGSSSSSSVCSSRSGSMETIEESSEEEDPDDDAGSAALI